MCDDTKRNSSPITLCILHLSFLIYYRSSQTCLVFLPQTCRVRVPCSRHNHLVGSARSSTRTRPELSDNCIFAKRIVAPDSHGPIGRSWSMILLLCPELSYYQTIITFTMQLCTSKKKYFQTFPEPTSGKESGSGHWKLSVTGTMFVSSCKAVESSRRKLSSSSTFGKDLQTNGLLSLMSITRSRALGGKIKRKWRMSCIWWKRSYQDWKQRTYLQNDNFPRHNIQRVGDAYHSDASIQCVAWEMAFSIYIEPWCFDVFEEIELFFLVEIGGLIVPTS